MAISISCAKFALKGTAGWTCLKRRQNGTPPKVAAIDPPPSCRPSSFPASGSSFRFRFRGGLLSRGRLFLRRLPRARRVFGEPFAPRLAVPFLEGIGRDLSLDEKLCKFATLRLALERHVCLLRHSDKRFGKPLSPNARDLHL